MLTVLGKIKGARYCKIENNILKNQLKQVLSSMIVRCYCPSHPQYKNYGAKGIDICPEWTCNNGLDNFYEWSISQGFNGLKTDKGYNIQEIDRIDNTKGYSPENCRWVTHKEQSRNKTTNRNFTLNGETKCLKNWCEDFGLPYMAIYLRIFRRRWSFEKAITTPIKTTKRGHKNKNVK